MLENKQMLYELLTQPEDFVNHIRRYTNALTTTMVFGWRTPTYEDEKMKKLFDSNWNCEINKNDNNYLLPYTWIQEYRYTYLKDF